MNVRFVPNQSENGKYNLISGWFNKIPKIFLCVCIGSEQNAVCLPKERKIVSVRNLSDEQQKKMLRDALFQSPIPNRMEWTSEYFSEPMEIVRYFSEPCSEPIH